MNTHTHENAWGGFVGKTFLTALMLVWFGAAYIIGSNQSLVNTQLSAFPPIAITAIIPVAGFIAAYALVPIFRRCVLMINLQTLTRFQYWRVIGFTFLPLYAFDILPGLFALPAGLGDVAIGLAAPLIIARMNRDPDYVMSSGFVRYNLLGLLDFVSAVATSGLAAGGFADLVANNVTTAPLDIWPLNLFPSFIVPFFIIIHFITLMKVRALRQANKEGLFAAPQTA
jgi:hypothetical protein